MVVMILKSLNTEQSIIDILNQYRIKFKDKIHTSPIYSSDILLEHFNITANQIRQNKQYWNRELGMCWQKLIIELLKDKSDYQPAIRINRKELCDLVLNKDAIDTKYRLGSGDSGTINKLKDYAQLLLNMGYRPVLLILREDNLKSTISACEKGGWHTIVGNKALKYIESKYE
jgi:hypothetical protein